VMKKKKHSCNMMCCHSCGWVGTIKEFNKICSRSSSLLVKCPYCNKHDWRRVVVQGIDIFMSY
jgi:hypothetical protein